MATNVVAQKLGGEKRVLDNVNTVRDVQTQMSADGYTASVNGDPAKSDTRLNDGDFVSLAQPVKGGA
jgi:sulfur carrier protein ThiS